MYQPLSGELVSEDRLPRLCFTGAVPCGTVVINDLSKFREKLRRTAMW